MTHGNGGWEQLELFLVPTVAMRRGDQTVWQCAHCGTVVIIPSAKKPQHGCPGCERGGVWWEQHLPRASAFRPPCPSCAPTLAGFARADA